MQAPATTSSDELRELDSALPAPQAPAPHAPARDGGTRDKHEQVGDGRREAAQDEAWRGGLRRVAYWTPVWVPMILFAHLAWLGLRPALSEAERLDDYSAVLAMREGQARSESVLVKAHLDARLDPVYQRRQERLRAQYHPHDVTRLPQGESAGAGAR